jgi:2-methylisocitrate lyase-like PEP mutase family enzyme
MNGAAGRLRTLLAERATVVAPFAFDGLQARLAEAAGFPAVYLSGFGTAAAHGLPDVGLLSLAEMAANVARLSAAVHVPVVADADTGFGGPLNVARTVDHYARAGAAALHLEDQVWPKRCGFMAGKEVIPAGEMVAKVRAAVDSAAALGPEDGPLVIARTDALAPHGWDEAVERARCYRDAGADLLFVDGIRSRRDAATYAERLGDLPLVYNGMLPLPEAEALGFRLVLAAGPLLAGVDALARIYCQLAEKGEVPLAAPGRVFDEVNTLLGLAEVEELRARYGEGP